MFHFYVSRRSGRYLLKFHPLPFMLNLWRISMCYREILSWTTKCCCLFNKMEILMVNSLIPNHLTYHFSHQKANNKKLLFLSDSKKTESFMWWIKRYRQKNWSSIFIRRLFKVDAEKVHTPVNGNLNVNLKPMPGVPLKNNQYEMFNQMLVKELNKPNNFIRHSKLFTY